MKKIYFISILFFSLHATSQSNYSILDQNNASASISDGGSFLSSANGAASYRVPKDSLQNLIFGATNWFGGVDIGGQIKLTASSIGGSSTDLWPGVLTNDGAATASPIPDSITIWTVTKTEIYQHLLNFQNPGYVAPLSIQTWPAHGDVSQNFDFYLAPFVDVNNDGNYDYTDGDYPCIKGDQATFMVLNDKKSVHGSGGDPIGLELHYMFYQYDQPGDQENTTFLDLKIINRGTQTLFDFYTSFVMDGDLGNSSDDYFGCDSSRNVQYYYNDPVDENSSVPGFGASPPSFGVVCLSDEISTATSYSSNIGSPNTVASKYFVMQGLMPDGSPRLNSSSNPTTFTYYDEPSNSTGWSALTEANMAGDQRTVMSINMGTLTPQLEKTITYAIVYNRNGTSNIDNVDELLGTVDDIQSFYNASADGDCSQSILSIEEKEVDKFDFVVYPNPSDGEFSIRTDTFTSFQVSIRDMMGRQIIEKNALKNDEKFKIEAPVGIYFVSVQTEFGSVSKRISIK